MTTQRIRVPDKETNQLIEHVTAHGWRAERAKNHVRLIAPDGAGIVLVGSTPSDWRAHLNTVARLKRLDPTLFIKGGKR